ncbi:unnamed protein product, partial [Prorocentrum cordatum]
TCSGKAATPCPEWAGECYMYCDGADRRLAQGEGQQCGSSGSDGHFYGDCSSGLECVAPAAGSPVGAPSTCQKVGQQEGQQCGSSGSDGHFYGDCSPGLACVPPADGDAMVGAPSICHKVCGSFGADGDHVNGTCSASQTCSGKAATPCRVRGCQTCSGKAATPCRKWAGECYMYCDGADRRLAQGEGQQCGSSGSDGHFYGDCSSGLECVAPAAGSPVGAPSTCQKVGQQEGQQCGSSGSDGHFYGDCSPGLACVPLADGDAMVGAPSICHKVCGSFGADGHHVNGTCSASQTCSGKAATPCREWAGECYMYCKGGAAGGAAVRQQRLGRPLLRRLLSWTRMRAAGRWRRDGGRSQHLPQGVRQLRSRRGPCQRHLQREPDVFWQGGHALPGVGWRVLHVLRRRGAAGGAAVRQQRLGRAKGSSVAAAARTVTSTATAPRDSSVWLLPRGSPLGAPSTCQKVGQQEGQQCGSSGSDGHFYGDCSHGLACVPPADGDAMVGAPSICHKVCGSFGADGDHVNGTCSASQTCSGKATTPCREWVGECYMYCDGADRRLAQGEGQQCGSSGSDGHFYGDCSSGLECHLPEGGAAGGAAVRSSGSDGHFYGDCSPGLACVPPADGDAMVGAPSICHKVCGMGWRVLSVLQLGR